jgi:glucose/arabinose dehydrogenase
MWRVTDDRSPGHRRARSCRTLLVSAGVVVGLVGLAACSTADASSNAHPTWVPQQSTAPEQIPTPAPPSNAETPPTAGSAPSEPGQQSPPSGSQATPGPSPSTSNGKGTGDPNVVATKLTAPTGLTLLPDGTALVGERTTGRIVDVQKTAGQPVKIVRTLTGLDPSGGGGLLDLALSPSYAQTGLILALVTTLRDTRVLQFTATGPVTTLISRIPRGTVNNTGRLLVLANGDILIGTGDAGHAALASDASSLAGKVLRIDDLGAPAPGNPTATSTVFTSGLANVNGLCLNSTLGTISAVQAGRVDRMFPIAAGTTLTVAASTVLPAGIGGVGDCAISSNSLYVTGRNGQDVFRATLDAKGKPGPFTGLLKKKYGRLLTVVAATDGSLWLTTTNKDGHGKPVAADERVLHIMPSGGGGGPSGA